MTIVYGIIEHNYAINDGGGFLVSAVKNDVQVKMLSGSLSSNKAGNSGGGMAVETSEGSAKKITVEIGCLLDHKIDSTNKPNLPIDYTDTYIQYNKYGQHKSCPIVKNNTAEEIGGGFFMNSSGSTLSFYCVEEGGNIANAKDNSAGMDVEGGKVVIGDENYHNHEYNEKQPDKQSVPYGYISMDNATLVNGGQVDIYGDMTNPIFKDEVTVDIENKDTDHFLDHRRAHKFEQRYKVHYIENFQGTGLYQAYQYEDSEAVITIKGALYSHPGYSIVGWYTKSVYDPTQPDKDHQFYEVGDTFDLRDPNTVPQLGKQTINCDKCGETVGDSNLLELYAIWEANGYIVHFDPNVPDGETYTGSMENQILQYGVEANLSENGYKYMGHFFAGWATSPNPDLNPNPGPDPVPDGSSIPYPDKAQVLNLTDKKGATVVLYAQWILCDHKDPTRWSYRVEGNAIIRDCSCGGQTLSAALIAEDTVYDGFEHPAKLVCTDEDKIAWGNDLPDIAYTSKWLEDGLTHTGYGPELSVDGKPFHAGVYTASITKVNMTVDSNGVTVEVPVTAKIDYIISKADQEQPEKPTYTTPTESQAISSLNVNRLDNDPAILIDAMNRFNEAKAQYRVSYYSNSGFVSTEWQYYSDNVDKTITINLPAAYTSYFVEARYEELDDYNPSDIVRADAVYYFTGNVKVIVECDEGIQYNLAPMKEEGSIAEDGNGLKLDLTTKEGYYLVSDNYTIGCTAVKDDNAEIQAPTITPESPTPEDGNCTITEIKPTSTITLTIGTTRKKPVIDGQVAPGQVFRSFKGQETTISRDSAFTAAFKITNFDPYYTVTETKPDGSTEDIHYGAYDVPVLEFSSSIPAKATIILVDSTSGSKEYWYYHAESDVTEVQLTDFKKMGGGANPEDYKIPEPAQVNGYVNLNYQFIVDFSQCDNNSLCSEGVLTMTLEAKANSVDSNAPEIKRSVDVAMVTSDFELTEDTPASAGLTNSFKCRYSLADGARASKWEDRSSALVLKPATDTNLPQDARIKAVVGSNTTYLNKSDGQFIVPMSLLKNGTENVTLTLESALFPKEEASYKFSAEWWISQSKASRAPNNGYMAGNADITFTSSAKTTLSLKPDGNQRVLTARDTLKLDVKTKNMNGYKVTATLERENEGHEYASIGKFVDYEVIDDDKTIDFSMSMSGQTSGSYRILFTVKMDSDDAVEIVLKVPYYFVIADR